MNWKLQQLLAAREIKQQFAFLTKNGIPESAAIRMLKKPGQFKRIDLKYLFILCKILYCTPNDLLGLTSKEKDQLPFGHPMKHLQEKNIKHLNLNSKLRELPLGELEEVNRLLEERKKANVRDE